MDWLNLFREIDNQPDQQKKSPHEPTKSNADSTTRKTLVGYSVGPTNCTTKSTSSVKYLIDLNG